MVAAAISTVAIAKLDGVSRVKPFVKALTTDPNLGYCPGCSSDESCCGLCCMPSSKCDDGMGVGAAASTTNAKQNSNCGKPPSACRCAPLTSVVLGVWMTTGGSCCSNCLYCASGSRCHDNGCESDGACDLVLVIVTVLPAPGGAYAMPEQELNGCDEHDCRGTGCSMSTLRTPPSLCPVARPVPCCNRWHRRRVRRCPVSNLVRTVLCRHCVLLHLHLPP